MCGVYLLDTDLVIRELDHRTQIAGRIVWIGRLRAADGKFHSIAFQCLEERGQNSGR